jgi:cytochrome c oxidase cbb3-type subunit III
MRKTHVLVGGVALLGVLLVGKPAWAAEDDGGLAKARENYQTYCMKCHGESGKGDGPGAAMLNPKPRDYTDCKTMQGKKDEELFKVIKDGGDSVGLSADMQPFGGNLSDDEIHALVKFVRGFCKQP